jgi:hypothetical protein
VAALLTLGKVTTQEPFDVVMLSGTIPHFEQPNSIMLLVVIAAFVNVAFTVADVDSVTLCSM